MENNKIKNEPEKLTKTQKKRKNSKIYQTTWN